MKNGYQRGERHGGMASRIHSSAIGINRRSAYRNAWQSAAKSGAYRQKMVRNQRQHGGRHNENKAKIS